MSLMRSKHLRPGCGIRGQRRPSAIHGRRARSSFRSWISRCVVAAPVLVVAFCSDAPTSPQASLAGEDSGGLSAALDDGNTIHACKKNQSGDVRLVDDADQCKPSETLVEWGVQGPAGPSGVVDTHVHTAEGTGESGGVLVFALCEPGEVALGGGWDASLFVEVADDAPVRADAGIISLADEGETPNGWFVQVDVPDSNVEVTLQVRVICAPTGDGA